MDGIRERAQRHGLPVLVTGFGAAFTVHFTKRAELRDYRDTLDDDAELLDGFLRGALEEGLHVLPDGRFYVSAVHAAAEVEETLGIVDRVFATLGAPARRGDAGHRQPVLRADSMVLHRHQDLERTAPAPGLFRIIAMDEKLGAGAITQGMVTIEPGRADAASHAPRRGVDDAPRGRPARADRHRRSPRSTPRPPSWRPRTRSTPSETSGVRRRCLCIAYRSVNRGHVLRRRGRVLRGTAPGRA